MAHSKFMKNKYTRVIPNYFNGSSISARPNSSFKGTPDLSQRFGYSERGAP